MISSYKCLVTLGKIGKNIRKSIIGSLTLQYRSFLFSNLSLVCFYKYFLNSRSSEIHLFYNLQLFYWHFLEFLWLFIFLIFYKLLVNPEGYHFLFIRRALYLWSGHYLLSNSCYSAGLWN